MPATSPQFREGNRGTMSQNYVNDAPQLSQTSSHQGGARQNKLSGDAATGSASLDKFMPKSYRDSQGPRERSSPTKLNKGR